MAVLSKCRRMRKPNVPSASMGTKFRLPIPRQHGNTSCEICAGMGGAVNEGTHIELDPLLECRMTQPIVRKM
jgi:hypothetical protein